MEFLISTGNGRFDLEAGVRCVGEDLVVTIWGGEVPHVGAVAVAQPRPSLRAPHDTLSATASVICLPGHKEDDLAKQASQALAAGLNRSVVVCAGMHWENLTVSEIETVERKAGHLTDLILEKLEEEGLV